MKRYFLTGLALFLPVTSTLLIILWIFNHLTAPFLGLTVKLFESLGCEDIGFWIFCSEDVVHWASRILIVIFLVLFTFALGYVVRYFLVTILLQWGERLLEKIPFIRTVYRMIQDIMKTILIADKKALKQVVVVPFTQNDIYCLGLVSKEAPIACQNAAGEPLISVFIPSTPNPTTGFVVMFPEKDLIYLNMKPEEVIKFIVSLGVIQPEERV